jgi:hypothetical protein
LRAGDEPSSGPAPEHAAADPQEKAPASHAGDEPAKPAQPPAASAAAEPEPPAASVNPNQTVVDPAIKALLAVAKREDNPYRYIFLPVVQRKLVDYQLVPQRYRATMCNVPVYQYQSVTVTQPVTQGTQTMMTTRQQSVPVRQIGVRPEQRLVPDPNGPITQMIRQPIWGPGGPDRESFGWLGNNAMALVALLRSGVNPAREPALKTLADRLSQHLQAFDSPDLTWDVAWTIIALAEYPGGSYHDRVERLLGRLLSGQIGEGPGKGLWGPVCVNPRLLRQAVEVVMKNQAVLPQGGGAARAVPRPPARGGMNHGVNPGMNPAQAALKAQIEAAQERAFIELNAVSALGPSFAKATRPVTIKDARNQYGNDIEVPGWPVNVYRELTGDLESTALAAYALRVAATQAKLPATIEYPRGVSFCRSFSTREVLATALRAVAAAQRDDGSWDEMTAWQPVDEFRNGNEGQFGPVVTVPEALPAGRPPIATAQACNAMDDLLLALGRLAEPKKAARLVRGKGRPPEPVKLADPEQYRRQIARGREHLLAMIADVAGRLESGEAPQVAKTPPARSAKRPPAVPPQARPLALNPVWGGAMEPYALLCQLRLEGQPTSPSDENAAAARTALDGLMTATILSQQADGLWPAPADYVPWTPSVRERDLYLAAPPAEAPKKTPPHAAGKKTSHTPAGGKAKSEHGNPQTPVPPGLDVQPFRTMAALSALRNPPFWMASRDETERLATVYMLCYLAGTLHAPPPDASADSTDSEADGDKSESP